MGSRRWRTIRELLVHYSGLAPDLDLAKRWEGKETAYRIAFEVAPEHPPGASFGYSDINFIVPRALVERLSGEALDQYAAKHIFAGLGLKTRGSCRLRHGNRALLRLRRMKTIICCGEWCMILRRGGWAESRAMREYFLPRRLPPAIFAQALLDGGRGVLTPATVAKMTAPQQPVNGTAVRGFGWDIDSPLSSNRGELLPVGGYGHTGFTGTSLWIDPATKTYIVLLTNAVHMNAVPPAEGEGAGRHCQEQVAMAVAARLYFVVDSGASAITGYTLDEGVVTGRPGRVNGAVSTELTCSRRRGSRRCIPAKVGAAEHWTADESDGRGLRRTADD